MLGACGFVYFRSTQPPNAEVVEVRQENVVATLAVSGVLEAVERTSISSQIAGARIASIPVDIGDSVAAGDPLIVLDDADVRAQIAQAEAQIARGAASGALQSTNASNAERQLALARQVEREATELRLARQNAQTAVNTSRERVRQSQANLDRVRKGGREEAVRQAQAQLSRAKDLLSQRKRELDRARKLEAEGAIPGRDLELAQTAFQTAERDVEIANQQLAQIETSRTEDVRQAEGALREAQAAFEGAQRALALAETNLRDRLAQRQAVVQAQTQLDQARASQRVSDADVTAARAQLQLARAELDKRVIRAPFAGRVAERLVEPGQTVSPGLALMTLANPRSLRVRLDVDEANLSRLRVGEETVLSVDAFPDRTFQGEVAEIGSSANFQRGTVEVRVRLLEQPDFLKPDLTVDADIRTASYPNALVVPRQALVNPDEKPQLFVEENGVVQARDVKWTRGNVQDAVILSGVESGMRVLLEPRRYRPGQRVNAQLRRSEER